VVRVLAANPGKFIPHLWRWLADGDWETSPPTERKPPAKSRKDQLIDDLFASLDAKKRGAYNARELRRALRPRTRGSVRELFARRTSMGLEM
jgi:hypothetical protein